LAHPSYSLYLVFFVNFVVILFALLRLAISIATATRACQRLSSENLGEKQKTLVPGLIHLRISW